MKHSYMWVACTTIWGFNAVIGNTIDPWICFMLSGYIAFLFYNNTQLKDSWKA